MNIFTNVYIYELLGLILNFNVICWKYNINRDITDAKRILTRIFNNALSTASETHKYSATVH